VYFHHHDDPARSATKIRCRESSRGKRPLAVSPSPLHRRACDLSTLACNLSLRTRFDRRSIGRNQFRKARDGARKARRGKHLLELRRASARRDRFQTPRQSARIDQRVSAPCANSAQISRDLFIPGQTHAARRSCSGVLSEMHFWNTRERAGERCVYDAHISRHGRLGVRNESPPQRRICIQTRSRAIMRTVRANKHSRRRNFFRDLRRLLRRNRASRPSGGILRGAE